MNLENYNPMGNKSEAQLQKDQSRMEETLEALKQEKGFLEKEIAKEKLRFEQGSLGAGDFTGEREKESQRQKKQQQEQAEREKVEQEGLRIGSFNINSLDVKVRYAIGFGLMGLCVLVLFWFMKQLKFGQKKDSQKKSH